MENKVSNKNVVADITIDYRYDSIEITIVRYRKYNHKLQMYTTSCDHDAIYGCKRRITASTLNRIDYIINRYCVNTEILWSFVCFSLSV
jgi:hypothetical protein